MYGVIGILCDESINTLFILVTKTKRTVIWFLNYSLERDEQSPTLTDVRGLSYLDLQIFVMS